MADFQYFIDGVAYTPAERNASVTYILKPGQRFLLPQFTGELVFTGSDFEALLALLGTDAGECKVRSLEVKEMCSGSLKTRFEWAFWIRDGEFDCDKCTYTVTPRTVDHGTIDCILEGGANEVNILGLGLPVVKTKVFNLFFVASSVPDPIFNNTHFLQDVLRELAIHSCSGVTGITSDFFQWNPDNPSSINYATLTKNRYTHITISPKSNCIDPIPTNPATVARMTLKQLLIDLNNMFDVYWTLEADGTLRLEHLKYYSSGTTVDLTTTSNIDNMFGKNVVSFNNSLPNREEWTFEPNMETIGVTAGTVNRARKTVTYGDCGNDDSNIDRTIVNFFHDYTSLRDTAFPKTEELDRFVIFFGKPSLVNPADMHMDMYNGSDIQGEIHSRMSQLFLRCWKDGRPALESDNASNGLFKSTGDVRIVRNITLPDCCDDPIDLNVNYKTKFGVGRVTGAVHNPYSGNTSFDLGIGLKREFDSSWEGLTKLWLKADAGITVSGGGVSLWEDQSPMGRDFSQPTVANRPTYGPNPFLSGNAVNFNGVDQHMFSGAFGMFPVSVGSVYAVFYADFTVTHQPFIIGTYNQGGNDFGIGLGADLVGFPTQKDWLLTYSQNGGVGYAILPAREATNVAAPWATVIQVNGPTITSAYATQSGTGLTGPVPIAPLVAPSSNPVYIGGPAVSCCSATNFTPDDFLKGTISEIIVFDDILDEFKHFALLNYLEQKYGSNPGLNLAL